ncbi:probable G-protein coupled receptor 179, partial [Sylvia atricapilla]|uniref:probable G-protein coupled receptor 179 n=1 Tax=Sylvia atricapilla TaxID=48155 RepID=UPI0033964C77
GVVRVDVELRDVTIDQCSSGPGWFSDTHRCDLNSTQCVPQESRGLVLGRYLCRCKPGFYGAGGVASGAWAGAAGTEGGSRLGCRPCRPGCVTCEDDAPCLAQEDAALRAAVLACQACCMLAIFLSMLVAYHFRRSKRIRASGLVLLETILFGSLLLYFPVFILYFKPSVFRCIVLRWVRLLGFATVYGTITLKLYRVLKVFLSRSAQRSRYVSSGRVLRLLAPILLLVLWFLAAWTMAALDRARRNLPLVIPARTARGLRFPLCAHDCWDYMMVIAEMLFLLWGSFLCYATRAVPSAFHEPRYMGIALHNELMVSAAFHLVRFLIVPSLHPDWTLLLFFAHTHGTVTMTLALLFVPKFLHSGSPLREEITAEVYEDELDMRRSGSCMNSSIASAWSERSLDPDDIREELKKLYRQLEVHKTWRMATDNPHLAKKRSSRRSLTRSILRRSTGGTLSRRSSTGDTLSRRSSSAKRFADPSPRMRDENSRSSSDARGRGSPTPSPPAEAAAAAGTEWERSDSDSLDAAPLLCKSASAQNLTGHYRHRAPGRPPPLQKSHSVVTGAREAALLAARRAARDGWHGGRHLSAPVPGGDTATPQSPAEKGSRQDTAPLGDGRGHKHVTYAPIKSVSVDSAHPARRVRVTVKKTPPPPPVRYQSLQRSGTLGDSPEPPPGPPARGTAGDKAEHAAGKGRLLTPSASSAHVCPWELVQDEILSRKQKAAEATESGTVGDTAATGPKQKSFRSLGLAIKALSRSRGKSVPKGRSEGSLRKRGSSRREKCGPDQAKSAEGSGQSLEVPALQRNNNAATAGDTCGDRGTAGHRDGLAAGTGDGDKAAEERRGDAATGEGLEPPSAGHQGAECPQEVTRLQPHEGDEAPAGDIPGVTAQEGTLEQLEGPSQRREHPEEEQQPPAKRGPGAKARAEVGPPGSLGIPAGRAALLRQEAIAPREDGGIPENPDEALGNGSGQPQPEAGPGRSGSAHGELSAAGDASSKPGIGPGKSGTEGDAQRPPSTEKPAELPKVSPKAGAEVCPWESWDQRRSVHGEICPWDTEGVPPEQEGRGSPKSGMGFAGKPPALPKASSQRAGTTESKKANICPWVEEDEPSPKTEICPWEEAAAPAGKERMRQDTGGTSKGEEKVGSREKGKQPPGKSPSGKSQSLEKAEICPWESQDVKSSDKAEICPWESQDVKSSDKAEICPWEVAEPQMEKGTAPGKGASKTLEKGSKERESICPWESPDTEQLLPKPQTGSSALPKAAPGKSQSSEKAEICPWESQDIESTGKAEICPWESQDSKSSDKAEICPWEGRPLHGRDRGAICPWESQDSKSSDKAEICPWESQDSKSSDKAEICPWEGAEPQVGTGIAPGKVRLPGKEDTKVLEKGSRDRESICPWESSDTEQLLPKPQTGSSALPKAAPGKSQSSEKAEICPWESQDVEHTGKAEICPWEGAEPQVQKGTAPGKVRLPGTEPAKALEKSSKERESICPWESPDTEQPLPKPQTGSSALPKAAPGKSQSSEKAEICPWESQDVGHTGKAEICPWESQDSKSSDKAEICPWEGAEPPSQQPKAEQVPAGGSKGDKRITRQAALASPERPLHAAPGKSQSSEKAEICPWESQDVEHTGKAEICPWEGAEPQVGTGTAPGKVRLPGTEPAKALEKSSKERESICPWESSDVEQPLPKPQTGSSALPRSPSGKPQSSEKAEICPWEVESTGKAEICPWEWAEPQVGKGTAPGKGKFPGKEPAKALEKSSKERESICPWESPDTEQLLTKPQTGSSALPKAAPGKSQSSEKAEICPWEVESTGKAEICPWESQDSKSSDKAEICPWESQDSKSSDKAEICPWEGAEPQVGKGTAPGKGKFPGKETAKAVEKGSKERESICPWESPDTEELSLTTAVGKEPSNKSESTESRKSEICPWEAAEPIGPEEETSQPQGAQGVSSTGTGQPGAGAVSPALPEQSRGRSQGEGEHRPLCRLLPSAQHPGVGSSSSPGTGRAQVCPWEAAEAPSAPAKAGWDTRKSSEVCPWEEESTDPARSCPGQGRAAGSPRDGE